MFKVTQLGSSVQTNCVWQDPEILTMAQSLRECETVQLSEVHASRAVMPSIVAKSHTWLLTVQFKSTTMELKLHEPRFKSSGDTHGGWLPYWMVQV